MRRAAVDEEQAIMCITRDRWQSAKAWNWDGDHVIHECIVPSGRPAVGSKQPYDIDIREFLITEKNEVIRRTLREDLPEHQRSMPGGDAAKFTARTAGAFDYRARALADFVATTIDYPSPGTDPRGRDPWQFPDETLALRRGDCEDRALLLASLLLASGISSFHVRVALGKLCIDGKAHDHAWVMYKNESGRWLVLDPPPSRRRTGAVEKSLAGKPRPRPRLDYEPYFLWNDVHLWAVRRPDATSLPTWLRRAWRRIRPEFHGEVHHTILERALGGVAPKLTKQLLTKFGRPILGLFGPLVDDIDRLDYDPVQHFDNGYIDEGWDHVDRCLQRFRQDRDDVMAFALAAHAIGDFYAHSSYAHLSHEQRPGVSLPLYDRSKGHLGGLLDADYGRSSLQLGSGSRFTVNRAVFGNRGLDQVLVEWNGKIISGRYAQEDDTHGDIVTHVTEGLTWLPDGYLAATDFWRRGGLPHHDEIAVDAAEWHRHKLYRNRDDHAVQFALRTDAAIRHIRKAYIACVTG